jgi:26S proteasome regulatory subunit N1
MKILQEQLYKFLMSDDRLKDLKDTLARFLTLGLGLLFLGKQEASDAILETTKVLDKVIAKQCEVTVLTCAYAGSGNVLKVQQLLKICGEKIDKEKESNAHQAIATLGIALIAMGEELGAEMAIRSFDHLLQYADLVVKRAVPLGLGLLCVSNPKLTVMDTLSKLSHDIDAEVAQGAILGLGLIGAGTNNARVAQLLRQLSGYYSKDPNCLFMVRIAQGILYMGKGLITLSPYHMERTVMNIPAMSGLLTLLHSSLDMKNIILGKYHYLLYVCASAMYPRMLVTVDEELKPVAVNVRVGQAVDIVAQAGRPKTITGFQTHNTPVLLQHGDRAELATQQCMLLFPF